jgi:hypothetical protein
MIAKRLDWILHLLIASNTVITDSSNLRKSLTFGMNVYVMHSIITNKENDYWLETAICVIIRKTSMHIEACLIIPAISFDWILGLHYLVLSFPS